MELKCRISYQDGVAKVYNSNGTESELYKNLLETTGDQTKALNLWAITQSEEFENIYPEGAVEVSDVMRYIDTRESTKNPLSESELFQIKSFMKSNGITMLSELGEIMNMIFKPNGVIDLNEQFAIESGLYTENDLREVDLNDISDLLQKIESQIQKEDITVETDVSEYYSKDSERKTIFGTSERASREEVNRSLYPLMTDINSVEDLIVASRELPYQDLAEQFENDTEFAQEFLNRTLGIREIPKLNFDNGNLTQDNLDYYKTLRNILPLEADTTKVEADLQILLDFDRTAWLNKESVRDFLVEVEKDFSDYNLDLVGLRDLVETPMNVISLVQSSVDMLNNPTDTNMRVFSELKESLIPTPESVRIENLPDVYKPYNIVELYTPKSDSELFRENGLIKVAENLYHKVDQNTPKSDIYEYIYDQYTKGQIDIPKRFILTSSPKDTQNKVSVLKDIEAYVNQRDTGLDVEDQELVSLFQVGFRHEPIMQNTPQQNVAKLSKVRTDQTYLKNEFVSDFYNYILVEKINNSEVYREVLKNFEVNDKDITLKSPIDTIEHIEMREELKDYIRLKKDSSMDYLLEEPISTTIDQDLLAINYPQQIKEYTDDLFIQGQYMVTPTNSENYLRANGKIYKKSLENNDSSLYIEFTPATDTVYLDNNKNFSFDTQQAQKFLNDFGIPPKTVDYNTTNEIFEEAKFNTDFNSISENIIQVGSTKLYYGPRINPITEERLSGIHFKEVVTPEEDRGKGYARTAVEKIIDLSEKTGEPIYLEVSPRDQKTDFERLKGFYESVGFREISDFEMVRNPNNKKPSNNFESIQENITNTSSIFNSEIKILDLYDPSEEMDINDMIDECG